MLWLGSILNWNPLQQNPRLISHIISGGVSLTGDTKFYQKKKNIFFQTFFFFFSLIIFVFFCFFLFFFFLICCCSFYQKKKKINKEIFVKNKKAKNFVQKSFVTNLHKKKRILSKLKKKKILIIYTNCLKNRLHKLFGKLFAQMVW